MKSIVKSEKGMATLEIIPLILIFVFLMAYTLGAFGIIHTGIMNSISARAYAFETFRNRSNLWYFRDLKGSERRQYRDHGNRFHGVMAEHNQSNEWQASERAVRMGLSSPPNASRNDPEIHNQKLFSSEQLTEGLTASASARNESVEVGPVWIMIQYGICINLKCGDQ